jgi:membrane-associated phospholipid phosphatase
MHATTMRTISHALKGQTSQYFRRLTPVDIVVIGHCSIMILLLAARVRQESAVAVPYLLRYLAIMAAALLVGPALDRSQSPLARSRLVQFIRHVYPVFLMAPFYRWVYPIGRIFFPVPYEDALLRADVLLFGFNVARDLAHRWGDRAWLTEWMNLSYLSYYMVTLYLPVYLYARMRMKEFYYTAFITVSIMFFCFAVHALFPSRGPHAFDPVATGYLHAGPVTEFARLFLAQADIPVGAMPSSHIAGTVAVLLLAYRFARPAFWFTLPVAASLCLSTVYCRYHYAVDGVAGILVALAGVYWAGPRLYTRLFPGLVPDAASRQGDTAGSASKPDLPEKKHAGQYLP